MIAGSRFGFQMATKTVFPGVEFLSGFFMVIRMTSWNGFFSLLFLPTLAWPLPTAAGELINFAEDTASNYHHGWTSGSNGGYGFNPWRLAAQHGAENSYAGFFIARAEDQPDLQNISHRHAFGLYANGVEFEEAVAIRPFQQALKPGEAFSVLVEHARIRTDGDEDRKPGSLGLVLRTGAAAESTADFDRGARFQVVYREGEETYRVIDGETGEGWDTEVPVTENGWELTFILREEDRYDLQVRTLEDDNLREWTDRRLGGESGAAIESAAFFNLNAEPRDLYLEGLQLNRKATPR